MCGICGKINLNKNNKKVSINDLNIVKKKIASRGPDSNGSWINNERSLVVSVHRLATQDSSSVASQPLFS